MATGEDSIPHGLGWLSAREATRLADARFTKRRTEYLLRRWAGKRTVAQAAGLPVDDETLSRIELLNRLTGAPYVEIDGLSAGVDISLTDRAGWAVALVGEPGSAEAGSLGVDLEIVEPRTAGFVRDFLTEPEQAYVHDRRESSGADGWNAAANLLWSAKEAALKVLRVGLRADTRTVEVVIDHTGRPDGWAPMTVTGQHGAVFPGWWRRDGVFLLTIAYRAPSPPPALLAGGADLARAIPTHSWLANPTVR
ncbi:MAG TPA: 4'-phosphopantetheinyl transferase superfamily protein [Candidatus Lustribacter sp.]|nr:4'-phosphopantetheinyl transferase superfamily protein [Candidatus Lustribacter sp.]